MPRDGTATRERILDAAQRLVIDRGFAATSIDAVLDAAATSKGAFFNHFPSKDALASALVERYAASDIEFLTDALAHAATAGATPRERALAFLQFFEDAADELVTETVGCLYTSVLADLELIGPATQGAVEYAIDSYRREYAALLRDAMPQRSDIDIEDLSDHVWVTFEGAYLLARATNDPSHLRRQLKVLRKLISAQLTPRADQKTAVSAAR
ncbi:MAG TPA: helix-turn-helix domain-containing protein [Aeromicrobium sp.]|nr:helix-turn-helix domain-containing protein [Aeromicrobium sp.]